MTRPIISKPPPITQIWMASRFDSIDRKLNLILAELKKLTGEGDVIPELEKAIKRNMALVRQIDRQVPDKRGK